MFPKEILTLLTLATYACSRIVSEPSNIIEARQGDLQPPCPDADSAEAGSLEVAAVNSLLAGVAPGNSQTCPGKYRSVTVRNDSLEITMSLYFNVSCAHANVDGYLPVKVDLPGGNVETAVLTIEDVLNNLLRSSHTDNINIAKQLQIGAQNFLNYWDAKTNETFVQKQPADTRTNPFDIYGQRTGAYNLSIIASPAFDGGYTYAITNFQYLDAVPLATSNRGNPPFSFATAASSADGPDQGKLQSGHEIGTSVELATGADAIAVALFVRAAGQLIVDRATNSVKTGDLAAYEVLILNVALAVFTNAISFEKDPRLDLNRVGTRPLPNPTIVARVFRHITTDQAPYLASKAWAPGLNTTDNIVKAINSTATCSSDLTVRGRRTK